MYTQETYTPRVKSLYRGTQAIWYIVTFLEVLLAFRLVMRLLAANPAADFTDVIYTITSPLVAPFVAVFSPTYLASGSVFEWTTLLAMFVYFLIGAGLARLLAMGRPVSSYEAREHLVEQDSV
ncbi:MAG: YggT family protein [Patescibacteria group bacterium]